MACIACLLSSSFGSLGSPGLSLANDSAASRSVGFVSPTYRPNVMCGTVLEDLAQALHLVVGQSVHRVQQKRADARCELTGLFVLGGQRVEDRVAGSSRSSRIRCRWPRRRCGRR